MRTAYKAASEAAYLSHHAIVIIVMFVLSFSESGPPDGGGTGGSQQVSRVLFDLGNWAFCLCRQHPKIGESKKFSFFRQRHALSRCFNIFVVTYRVTNFLPKLVDMLLFSTEKTDCHFFSFPYFRVLPSVSAAS